MRTATWVAAAAGLAGAAAAVVGLAGGVDLLVWTGVAVLLLVLSFTGFTVRRGRAEQDTAADPATAGTRVTGGDSTAPTGDRHSTTGAGTSGVHVGRVAGEPDSSPEALMDRRGR